jgi:hypothetical protein
MEIPRNFNQILGEALNKKLSNTDSIDVLEQIKSYLCSGNPIWNVEIISEAIDNAINALSK